MHSACKIKRIKPKWAQKPQMKLKKINTESISNKNQATSVRDINSATDVANKIYSMIKIQ